MSPQLGIVCRECTIRSSAAYSQSSCFETKSKGSEEHALQRGAVLEVRSETLQFPHQGLPDRELPPAGPEACRDVGHVEHKRTDGLLWRKAVVIRRVLDDRAASTRNVIVSGEAIEPRHLAR